MEELLHFFSLSRTTKKFSAAVMSDFFLDRARTEDLNHFFKATAQWKRNKTAEVADQNFQSFTDFFEVTSVRDKRHEERKIGV